jgi:LysM repeat protein
MKQLAILVCLSFFSLTIIYGQKGRRISADDYINSYKNIAVSEMKRSGIPASITLAQGMLESENGNSSLAIKANNHFGIKCHDWTGDVIHKDDDAPNECFRKYKSAEDSYHDHTDFLLSKQRYTFLFEYKSTDYKSWAKGLKKAGYATNPSYPTMLIKLIDENKLHLYDLDVAIADRERASRSAKRREPGVQPDFAINLNKHPVYKRNDVEYTVAKSGDTFDKLSRELDMFSWELLKYNELTKDSTLHDGQILYLQPKRRKAERGKEIHTVQPGESIYTISQLYAVKTRHIRRLNRLNPDDTVKVGDVLNLRSKKKK